MAEGVHLQYVVRQANHCPFTLHFLEPAQEKLANAAGLFHLSEYWLYDPFALGLNLRPSFGP